MPHLAALGIKYPKSFGDLLLIKEFRQSHHCIYYNNITAGYNAICIMVNKEKGDNGVYRISIRGVCQTLYRDQNNF